MWFKEASIEVVEEASALEKICDNCNNVSDHVLADQPYGVMVGIPFAKRPWLSSHRQYVLVCPICMHFEQVSKDVADALVRHA
jgi:hypothetical protein